jgi:hypothetical protein
MLVIRRNSQGRYFVVNTITGKRLSEPRYFKFMAEKDLRRVKNE